MTKTQVQANKCNLKWYNSNYRYSTRWSSSKSKCATQEWIQVTHTKCSDILQQTKSRPKSVTQCKYNNKAQCTEITNKVKPKIGSTQGNLKHTRSDKSLQQQTQWSQSAVQLQRSQWQATNTECNSKHIMKDHKMLPSKQRPDSTACTRINELNEHDQTHMNRTSTGQRQNNTVKSQWNCSKQVHNKPECHKA